MALSWLNLVSDDKKCKEFLLECHLMCLEVNVAQVQDGRENPKDCWLVLRAEVQDLHGSKQAQEVLAVILSCYSAVSALLRSGTQTEDTLAAIPFISWEYCWWCCVAAHLVEVIVGLSFLQIERLPLLRGKTCQHLVEDVIVPLILGLTKQTWASRGQMSRNNKKNNRIWHEMLLSCILCVTWKTIRDFSSRYWEVMAPLITPLCRKSTGQINKTKVTGVGFVFFCCE